MRFGLSVLIANLVVATLAAFGCTGHLCAEENVGQTHFDIPAQPLSTALPAFSSVTGAFGIYDGKLIADRRSTVLRGAFSPHAALAIMLEGTGLVAEHTSKHAFVVVAPQGAETVQRSMDIALAALSSLNGPEQRYFALLQQSLEAALCSTPLTRPGEYRAALSMAVDARGAVQRLRLLSSTGDGRRDAAIISVGGQTVVGEPPPSGMRQPFAMVILPRQSGSHLVCNTSIGRG